MRTEEIKKLLKAEAINLLDSETVELRDGNQYSVLNLDDGSEVPSEGLISKKAKVLLSELEDINWKIRNGI